MYNRVGAGCAATPSKGREKMKREVYTLQELLSNITNLDPTLQLLSKSLQTTKVGMSSDCVKTTTHQGEISDYQSFLNILSLKEFP